MSVSLKLIADCLFSSLCVAFSLSVCGICLCVGMAGWGCKTIIQETVVCIPSTIPFLSIHIQS